MPYDLSDDSGADRSAPVAQGSNLPTGRPSDAFRPPVQGGIRPGTPGYGGRGGASHEPEPFFMLERPTTPVDGTVRTLMTFA